MGRQRRGTKVTGKALARLQKFTIELMYLYVWTQKTTLLFANKVRKAHKDAMKAFGVK